MNVIARTEDVKNMMEHFQIKMVDASVNVVIVKFQLIQIGGNI